MRPPAAVLDLLSQHKADVLAMLAAIAYESNEDKLSALPASSESATPLGEDEPGLEHLCAARRGRVQASDGVLLHFCVECGRFAPYGYGVRLRTGQLGRWYCREHRPQEHDR